MFFCLLMSSHGIKGDRCDLMEESWAKQMVNNMHAWPRKRQQLRVPRTRELSFFADVRPVVSDRKPDEKNDQHLAHRGAKCFKVIADFVCRVIAFPQTGALHHWY